MTNQAQPRRTGPKETRPWSTIAVGESFFVSSAETRPSSIRAYAYKKGEDLGRKFSVMKMDGGVQVTRME